MSVPVYKIYQFFLFLSVFLLVGYFKLFPINIGFYDVSLVVLSISFLIIFFILLTRDSKIKPYTHFAKRYLIPYIIVVTISMYITKRDLGYSFNDLVKVIIPYLFIFMSIILIYIFSREGIEKTCRVVTYIVDGILIIKTISWVLYSFMETTIFPNLLFQYEGWIRDGFQRVDTGFLFFVALVWHSYQAFKNNKKTSMVFLAFYLLFTLFIARYRYLLIVILITMFTVFYYSVGRKNNKTVIRLLVVFCILGALIFGFFDKVLELFSAKGTYGSSTINRLGTLYHYYELVISRRAWCGLGLIDTSVASARAYMLLGVGSGGTSYFYYIDDLGVLGGVVRFGVLSIALYVPLWIKSIRVFLRCRKKQYKYLPIYAGICAYMIVSCIVLNIFDSQRAFDTPFYLAFISFIGGAIELEND